MSIAQTKADGRVVVAGLSAGELVAAAESRLRSGLTVLIDASDRPALAAALAEHIEGGRYVVLRPNASRWDAALTRVRDLVLAAVAAVLVVPILIFLAVVIRLSSPGPTLFRTTVVGRNGSSFVWRKLRTMRAGTAVDEDRRREAFAQYMAASPSTELGGKVIDEQRVTRIGRFLRRHSVDELPQLLNVIRGDMALVGPRPCLQYEYELQQAWQLLRFRVRPGLTGPWQVHGRSRVSFDEMVLIDYCYSRSRSFWKDWVLIFRTLAVVVTGRGGL